MRYVAGFVVCLLLLGAGTTAWIGKQYLDTPVGGPAKAVVTVKRGATLRPVLEDLAKAGVLTHPSWLYAYARLRRMGTVRSGNYEVPASDSPRLILDMLREGRVMLEAFTMAEGLNRWQVRNLLADAHWMTAEQFDTLCDNAQFLKENDIPGPSCEGYLYPETYKFARETAPAVILQTMFAAFKRQYADATLMGKGPLNLDERHFATLASIVEKETGAAEERPHIACVFYNRLRGKPAWRLETDPTVIYAATLADPRFDGNLKFKTLHELDSPYNTYRVFGLPPGPIANPGRAALNAVAQPSNCADYFFVSTNNGQHVFCPTLDCHNKAVKKWQVDYFQAKRASVKK